MTAAGVGKVGSQIAHKAQAHAADGRRPFSGHLEMGCVLGSNRRPGIGDLDHDLVFKVGDEDPDGRVLARQVPWAMQLETSSSTTSPSR
jgi:hypothetical protein